MSKRTLCQVAALSLLVVALGGRAIAAPPPQDATFSPQLFHPAVGPDEFFTVEPAKPLPHLNFSVGLWLDYWRDGFSVFQVNPDGSVGKARFHALENALSADLVAALGLWDRFQIGIGIPMALVQTGDRGAGFDYNGTPQSLVAPSGLAMGDPWLDLKVRLYGKDRGFNLALAAALTAPLGNLVTPDNFGGDRNVSVSGRALAGYEGERWRLGIDFGFLYRAARSRYFSTTVGNQLLYGVGAAWDAMRDRRLSLVGEVHGHTDVSGTHVSNLDASPLEIDLGVKVRVARPVYLTAGAGTGFIKGLGSPLARVFVGATYAPDLRDHDKDGVPDAQDKCPDQLEDHDGFKDDDGCPEPDNDGDGVLDLNDACPNQAEDFDGFQDEDGCPDLDNDGDGIPDGQDACPLDKEDGKAPAPNDGCPIGKLDDDQDGIPNERDKCPLDPEDKDGFQDEDGCPDVDNDEDGIPDGYDQCPNEPEDMDGHQDDDGCPDLDDDGDGVPDAQDKCPGQQETLNGVDDEDGCPDRGPELKVQIVGDEIVILEKVYFKAGTADIEAKSDNLLDQVASVLKLHPEVQRVLVEGHTDNVGSHRDNLRLSQARADAVKAYLVAHGVATGRLEAQGFGPDRPVADNTSARGREANRRVQFHIIQSAHKASDQQPAPEGAAP